ncbi:hypothetical protein INR49_023699, partial [Caranx melampygus]
MVHQLCWTQLTPKQLEMALPPFPRSTWIHPLAPKDNFDRVCKNIWSRAREAGLQSGRGRSPPETARNGGDAPPDREPSHHRFRDVSVIISVLGLTGPSVPHRGSTVDRLGRDVEDKQRSVENSLKKLCASQSISRTGKRRAASEPGPLATNAICSAERAAMHLQDEEDPPLPSRLTCKSEDEEEDMKRSSDSNASDDELVLPQVRSCATDNSDNASASDNSDCELEENEIPHLSVEFKSDSKQDPPPYTKEDFPPLPTIRSGIIPHPMETPALWKMHGQWEIPLSFHPHDIPTATLANGVTAPAQAPVRGKAKAPQTNSNTNAPPAAVPQQEAYDLLADFPALQPPKRPFALGVLQNGNPKTKDAKRQRGFTRSPNIGKESRASHQRRMENVPREVSPICTGDQKSVANLQTFGSVSERSFPTISCREMKANKQPPPRASKKCAGKVIASHQVTSLYCRPQSRKPNLFVKPGPQLNHQ